MTSTDTGGLPPVLEGSSVATLRAMRREPITLLERAALLGDVVRVRFPRFPAYVVNHPDLVWDVLATHHQRFMKGPTMQAAKRMLGESLLTSEGERHRGQRRLIQPIFHHERIAGYATTMVELADRWAADSLRDGEDLDLHREMAALTLSVVARTLFGEDVEDADASQIGRALTETLAQFGRVFSPLLPVTERIPFMPSNRRFASAKGLFDRTIYGMIADRRRSGISQEDLLGRLLGVREDGRGMTDQQIRDEAITLFLAGHETTAVALTWTWFLLSQHPEAEARLHAEVDGLAGRPPEAADLGRLRWTDAVVSESMRLFPPAWAIGRRAIEEHPSGGYRIPAGSVVVVSPWLLHHDPRWWGPDVGEFRPDRWLDADPDRPRRAFLPFGAGPRVCIGEGFAWMETRLILAAVATRWRFELDPNQRIELRPVVTLRPAHGMRMRAIRR